MPEIKHQFTGGKMNKDVDERLVPNGEYRHAMNVQVSTSEGSDVGTVQNILGNSKISIPFDVTRMTCVGSVSDEKSDSVYFFLSGPRFIYDNKGIITPTTFSRDHIVRLKQGIVEVVFTDRKIVIANAVASTSAGNPAIDYNTNTAYTPGGSARVSKGDVLEKIINSVSGVEKTVNHTVIHTHFPQFPGDPEFIVFDNLDLAFTANTECHLLFRSGCLNFDNERSITGINVIDDMLFWTDGFSEPKKINIPRSIEGTYQGTNMNAQHQTFLINKKQGITYASGVNVGEKHITVIKKAPSKPPTLQSLTSIREESVSGEALGVNFSDIGSAGAALKKQGDTLLITVAPSFNEIPLEIKVGDILLLNSVASGEYPPDNYQVRVLVDSVVLNGYQLDLNITIVSISEETPGGSQDYHIALSEEGYNLFQRKFPRFACRYRYEDGEYSSIGPFSDVAFIAGNFRYHPTEAYNKGMINNLKSLKLKDFIPADIPEDVVQVDILYKDEKSPEIYTVSTLNPTDSAWLDTGSFSGSYGSYEVTTENIYAVLPSNQLLRAWDNVPRSALAQDVVGNRMIYANYLQNYNVSPIPEVIAGLGVRQPGAPKGLGMKSIKSLRTYNVGVVYGDKYGRETPVFANEDSNQVVLKDRAASTSIISAQINTPHPSWAEYYKFFIKETASEYYNVALGRVYDAEDGNIWLSFPSSDRNKIENDTYLVLKKGLESDFAVAEEARYKVVAIENEAPEQIKAVMTVISHPRANPQMSTEVVHAGTSDNLNTARPPIVGATSFYIKSTLWQDEIDSTYGGFLLPDLQLQWSERSGNDLYVSFVGDVYDADIAEYVARKSEKYLITSVVSHSAGTAYQTGSAVYEVFVSTPFKLEVDWYASSYGGVLSGTQFRPIIHKKEIINKAEFDGRFFVKINSDEAAVKYLKKPFTEDIAYSIVANSDVFHFRDSDAPEYNDDGTLNGTVADIIGIDLLNDTTQVHPRIGPNDPGQLFTSNYETVNFAGNTVDGTYTMRQWRQLLRFGSPGSDTKGRWFVDQVSFAGTQPATPTNGQFRYAVTNSSMTDFNSSQAYGKFPNAPVLQNVGTGLSLGTQWQTGLTRKTDATLPNNLEHKLKLSYSEIEPDIYNGDRISTTNWRVGSGNPSTSSTSSFEAMIVIGSKFRIGGSANAEKTYTITNVEMIRTYNYRAGLPEPYVKFDDNRGSTLVITPGNNFIAGENHKYYMRSQFGSASNRRLVYDITYTIDGEDILNDLDTNAGFLSADATHSCDFQFIEQFDLNKQEPISRNPAIFETEPKETLDLDIYYEASGRIPTSITGGNGDLLIPIGSTLQIKPELEDGFGEPIVADGWGAVATSGIFQHNLLNLSPALTSQQFAVLLPNIVAGNVADETVGFYSVDGGIRYARVVGVKISGSGPNLLIEALELESISKIGLSWFNCWSFGNGVESNRIGDTYNKEYLSNGAKASSTLDDTYEEQHRKYGLIYSGIYNSTSGLNALNQFIAAEKITKDINPVYGSIQKLHARSTADGDLIALCEDRVLKILANRDALFNADGNTQLVSNENVLGQALPFGGEYGISTNPESFAAETYRAYFTDKVRGTVMRLSKDGLTAISDHGMKDWFRDNLKLSSKLVGGFDDKKSEYNLTLLPREQQSYTTVTELTLKSSATTFIPSIYQ